MIPREKGEAHKHLGPMKKDREPYLRRAREGAEFTIPHLLPPDGWAGSDLPTPWQSMGSIGLGSLSSKLLLSLFPTNTSFFRMTLKPAVEDEIEAASGDDTAGTKAQKALVEIERRVGRLMETQGYRPTLHEALKQILVAGQVCVYFPPETSGAVQYPLDKWVVRRDKSGAILRLILEESVVPADLKNKEDQEKVSEFLGEHLAPSETVWEKSLQKTPLFTHIIRNDDGSYLSQQELKDGTILGEPQTFKSNKELPWLVPRFERASGQDYSYGFIPQIIGDLRTAEGLSQALTEGAAAASKVNILVRPGGLTNLDDVVNAKNLAVIKGREEDVGKISFEKNADLQVAQQRLASVESRLAQAFLMNTSVQRSAERVTAEEVRFLANELEMALAGAYSLLSAEMQLPMVSLLLKKLEKEGDVSGVDQLLKSSDAAVVTGIEALGRAQEVEKLDRFLVNAGAALGQNVVAEYVNPSEYLRRKGIAENVDTDGLIRSEEEVNEARQAAAQQDALGKMGPELVRQGSQFLQNQGAA